MRPIVTASIDPGGPVNANTSSAGAAVAGAADSGESVIVTRTRSLNRKARDSTSPIDVISAATLRRSGTINLADPLVKTDPSIDIKSEGADSAALTAEIRLRGPAPTTRWCSSTASAGTQPPTS